MKPIDRNCSFMFIHVHSQTGGLCKLHHINGDEMVCNVEYNQLEDVIRSTIDERGDFADESGYSPYYDCDGNCQMQISWKLQ